MKYLNRFQSISINQLVIDISHDVYWRNPFHAISTPKQLKEFIIMDIDEDVRCKPHVYGRESHKVRFFYSFVFNNNSISILFLIHQSMS